MTHSNTATAATENASRYLQQLCKHWSHKAETEITPEAGSITFPNGNTLTLQAHADRLDMQASVPADGDLARFQNVVDRHIIRFAFREDLEINWA